MFELYVTKLFVCFYILVDHNAPKNTSHFMHVHAQNMHAKVGYACACIMCTHMLKLKNQTLRRVVYEYINFFLKFHCIWFMHCRATAPQSLPIIHAHILHTYIFFQLFFSFPTHNFIFFPSVEIFSWVRHSRISKLHHPPPPQ